MAKSTWFVAVLVHRTKIQSDPGYEPLRELSFRLIDALDAELAYARALELGRQAAISYRNVQGENLEWEFLGLADLRAVDPETLSDGAEIYAQFYRDAPSFVPVPKQSLSVF
jgi:hypothetical protein